MRRIAALFVLAGLAGACGGGSGADSSSGVTGVVLLGPQCPVEVEGSPCPDQPVAAELRVLEAGSNDVVATVRSGDDGRFRVALPPGSYVIESLPPTPGNPFPFAKPVDVTVRAGLFTEVTVLLDTGIR